ncbi:MAG: hypothetical protein NTZ05_03040, partial [Chloroflexi bacterium]|nr:hypothetical protein [Chloroflexota bacterium]
MTTQSPHATVAEVRAHTLAGLIAAEFARAGSGHCARVNYLSRQEAETVCAALRNQTAGDDEGFDAFVLVRSGEAGANPLLLTSDRAIELRNRKAGRLCLFVSADLVDAMISSLGNSFAEIDGRTLHRQALERVLNGLAPDRRNQVRAVQDVLRGAARMPYDAQLEFCLAALERERKDTADELGLELWRVGLIADRRPDFDRYVKGNREKTAALARPDRLGASARDRIAALKAGEDTNRLLESFFAGRPMNDVHRWSRALAEGAGPTFDRWLFPEQEQSDLREVIIPSFRDKTGAVVKTTKLLQPDGLGGTLWA